MKNKGLQSSNLAWQKLLEANHDGFVRLKKLEKQLDYQFKRVELLYEALTHRSASEAISAKIKKKDPTFKGLDWNERLEFLGDSVLGLIVTSSLYQDKVSLAEQKNNEIKVLSEGDLSKAKAQLVNEKALSNVARTLELDKILFVSNAERKLNTHLRDSLLCDALEALIGAIYLDSDYATTALIVERFYDIKKAYSKIELDDPKSLFQEFAQRTLQKTPVYQVTKEEGPAHHRSFTVGAYLGKIKIAEGSGVSKKKASLQAAEKALKITTQKPQNEYKVKDQL